MRLTVAFAVLLLITTGVAFAQEKNYTEEWKDFGTKLIRKEKSFQKAGPLNETRFGFEPAEFESEGMKLKALLNKSAVQGSAKAPAVVFLHGGFALTYGQLEYAKAFADAGFVVLAPSWRGENDNPGYFELFFGEVRDAKAAVRWLAEKDYVDPKRIYAFGWSVGGGISMNLSLHDDLPLKLTGSSAGVYDLDLIKSWATEDDYIKFPYDYKNERENYFRLPVYNLTKMVRPHITYIGKEDGFAEASSLIDGLFKPGETKLKLIGLEGDHESSLPAAIARFIDAIGQLEKAD